MNQDSASKTTASEAAGEVRVLRKLARRRTFLPADGPTRTGIVLDIETTGLDPTVDEVIELGMLKFTFSSDGRLFDVVDEWSALRQPTVPIPAEVTELTGITNGMVAGKTIDPVEAASFFDDAVLVIAHEARFDRPFCERLSPAFASKYWACSNTQADWQARGHGGTKLTYLLNDFGYFYDGHRAIDDCHAVLEVLSNVVAGAAEPAFATLLKSARKAHVRIWAVATPFEYKDALRARGYRWSDGSTASPRAWWKDVEEDAVEAEVSYLRTTFFANQPVEFPMRWITGLDRFSAI